MSGESINFHFSATANLFKLIKCIREIQRVCERNILKCDTYLFKRATYRSNKQETTLVTNFSLYLKAKVSVMRVT